MELYLIKNKIKIEKVFLLALIAFVFALVTVNIAKAVVGCSQFETGGKECSPRACNPASSPCTCSENHFGCPSDKPNCDGHYSGSTQHYVCCCTESTFSPTPTPVPATPTPTPIITPTPIPPTPTPGPCICDPGEKKMCRTWKTWKR